MKEQTDFSDAASHHESIRGPFISLRLGAATVTVLPPVGPLNEKKTRKIDISGRLRAIVRSMLARNENACLAIWSSGFLATHIYPL